MNGRPIVIASGRPRPIRTLAVAGITIVGATAQVGAGRTSPGVARAQHPMRINRLMAVAGFVW